MVAKPRTKIQPKYRKLSTRILLSSRYNWDPAKQPIWY